MKKTMPIDKLESQAMKCYLRILINAVSVFKKKEGQPAGSVVWNEHVLPCVYKERPVTGDALF